VKQYLRALFSRGPQVGAMDPVLCAVVVFLMGFGVVMVESAGVIEAASDFGDPHHFLKRQGAFSLVALGLLWAVSRFNYHKIRLLTYAGLGLVVVLMLLSVMGFGHSGGGAARWLKLGPIHVQPSEMAKVVLVLWLAYSLDKKGEQIKSFSIGLVPHFLVLGLLTLFCLKQPDFGSAAVLLFLTFAMLFVAGARVSYLMGTLALVGIVAAWAVRFTAYRWERVVAWSNMADHRQDLAYQPFQAAMSFGSGEAVGVGLGRGLQVLYLPESHTDFISAIIGEELGFIGIFGLAFAYLLIVARGLRIALTAEDEYGSHVAFGLSIFFGVQALVNLAVSMSILPTKGLTLPFVSYGGSSLLVNAAAAGVLLNISRPRRDASRNYDVSRAPEVSDLVLTESEFSFPAAVRAGGVD
jgi:cell division protein FtsW